MSGREPCTCSEHDSRYAGILDESSRRLGRYWQRIAFLAKNMIGRKTILLRDTKETKSIWEGHKECCVQASLRDSRVVRGFSL